MYSQQLIPRTNPEDEALRQERRAVRLRRRKQRRRARIILWSTISLSVILLLAIGYFYLQIQQISTIETNYPPINGVSCYSTEQTNFHIHAHVSIYINGKQIPIPQGVGIGANNICYYWLHTNTSDGIIHIAAPQQASNLALDDFLTIWDVGFAKLGFPQQLTLTTGWKIFVNGKAITTTVTSPLTTEVPMHSHDAITLEYGSNNPPPDQSYAFPANLPE
ncbi:MAG TPA: hypothetical protein VNE38_14840 [Ktedonobacteraceae bacterium]|nr:hypothetical protein [Ktedonobacteraceae bacterium]